MILLYKDFMIMLKSLKTKIAITLLSLLIISMLLVNLVVVFFWQWGWYRPDVVVSRCGAGRRWMVTDSTRLPESSPARRARPPATRPGSRSRSPPGWARSPRVSSTAPPDSAARGKSKKRTPAGSTRSSAAPINRWPWPPSAAARSQAPRLEPGDEVDVEGVERAEERL